MNTFRLNGRFWLWTVLRLLLGGVGLGLLLLGLVQLDAVWPALLPLVAGGMLVASTVWLWCKQPVRQTFQIDAEYSVTRYWHGINRRGMPVVVDVLHLYGIETGQRTCIASLPVETFVQEHAEERRRAVQQDQEKQRYRNMLPYQKCQWWRLYARKTACLGERMGSSSQLDIAWQRKYEDTEVDRYLDDMIEAVMALWDESEEEVLQHYFILDDEARQRLAVYRQVKAACQQDSLAALVGIFNGASTRHDLVVAGLWRCKVEVLRTQTRGVLCPPTGEQGYILTRDPVGLAIFDLGQEAPVADLSCAPDAIIGVR